MQRPKQNSKNIFHLFSFIILPIILLLALPLVPQAHGQELSEEEEYVFELKADRGRYVLISGFVVYRKNDTWYLPFDEIVKSMGFYIEGLDSTGLFEGYVREKSLDYKLDLNKCTAKLDGDQVTDSCKDFFKKDELWYVEKKIVEKIFSIELSFNTGESVIEIKSKVVLPSIAKENFKSKVKEVAPDKSNQKKILQSPYDWYDGANLYQRYNYTVNSDSSTNQKTTKTFHDIYLNGELMKMSADLTVAADDGLYKIPWASLKRYDPSGNMGGDAHLTTFEAGNVSPISTPLLRSVSRLTGFSFSNAGIALSTSSSTQNFQGDLKRGWYVELYQNDILIASQESNETQRYEFKDVTLFIGQNRFHLLFYGPHGEMDHSYITYTLSNEFASQQKFDFSSIIAVNDSGDSDNTLSISTKLTKRLMTTLYIKDDDDMRAQLDIKGFFKNTTYTLTQAYSSKGSVYGGDTSFQSGDLFVTFNMYDFNKYFINGTSENNEIDYQNSFVAFLPLFDFFQVQQSYKKVSYERSGYFTESYINRLIFPIFNHSIAHEATWDENSFNGEFFTRLNFFSFSNKISAAYSDEFEWNQYTLESGFNEDYFSYAFKILKHLKPDFYEFSLSMQKTLKAIMVFLDTTYNDQGTTSVTLGLGNLLSSDIKTSHYSFNPPRQREFGQILLTVFEDTNHNGQKDEHERFIKNFKARESYSNRTFKTDENGEIFIDLLPAWKDVSIDYFTEDIGNIFLYAFADTETFYIRPGKTFRHYVPLRTLGEVYGTIINTKVKDKSEYLVQLFLQDTKVTETPVEDDGYYYLGKLLLAKYTIRLFNKKTQSIVKEEELSILDPSEPSVEFDIKI